MVIKGIDKRAMIRDRVWGVTGLSSRVTLLTSTDPQPSMSNVDAFANRATSAPSKHIIHAVFTETRNANDQTDPVGVTRQRKGIMEFHAMYGPRVKAAYACTISGIPGRWKIMGVPAILGGITLKAYLEAME